MQPLVLSQLEWLPALEPNQQALIHLSYTLYEREKKLSPAADSATLPLADYSFVVFPMAKAYEGFLKSYLLKLQLIDKNTYLSRRFRIGRALNPDVMPRHQDEDWLIDDVSKICGQALGRQIWTTWLECRNHLFHYFPGEQVGITLDEAGKRLGMITQTMEAAWRCEISQS